MTDEEYVIILKNCASMLADGIKYMKDEHQKQFKEAYKKAIKALSEPTIPLSVIEDIKTELPNHSFWQDAGGEPLVAIRDVIEIIDRKVNEVTDE